MNILGIDFGQKRIGLAWVQEGLDVVLPFGVIQKNPEELCPSKLIELLKTEGIGKVVVGLPLGMEGEENTNTKRIRSFAEEVAKQSGLSVEFVDEKFTTHEANRMGGVASADEKAAMLILESYLES